MMTPQDLWYYVATVCILFITGFLVWALYEVAHLIHSANRMVDDTRDKIERFEACMISIGEKFSNASTYLGLIAEGAKQAMGMLHKKSRKEELEEELAALEQEPLPPKKKTQKKETPG